MNDGQVRFSSLSGFMQGVLILLSILGIVVPATLGFVNFDKRLDVTETRQAEHIIKDEVKWEKIDVEIDDLKDGQHELELQGARTEQNQQEILRRLDEYHDDLKVFMHNLEVVE